MVENEFPDNEFVAIVIELNQLGTSKSNVSRRIELIHQALSMLTNENNNAGSLVWAFFQARLGDNLIELSDGNQADNLEEAIYHYQQALTVNTRQAAPELWGTNVVRLAVAYANRIRGDRVENLGQAVHYAKQALEVFTRQEFPRRWAMVQSSLGAFWLRLADAEPDHRESHLNNAAKPLHQVITLFDEVDHLPAVLRAQTYYSLGRIYHMVRRWQEAIELLEQARETFTQHKARSDLAKTLLELGQLYCQSQDFETAYIYLKDALRLFKKLQDTDGIAVSQESLGNLALQTARPTDALDFFEEARQRYLALERDMRVKTVDHLMDLARQAQQVSKRKGAIS